MTAYKWIAILAVLMIGIGFSIGVISVQIAEGTPTISGNDASSSEDRRSHRDRRRHRRDRDGKKPRFDPFMNSVRDFSDTLELDDDQRARLDRVFQETLAEVARQERMISNTLLAQRRKVEEILTDEQRQHLEGLMQDEWKARRAERVARSMEWFREETDLGPDPLDEIESILREYEESKGAYFRNLRKSGASWPERKEMERHLGDLAAARNERLSRWLAPDLMKRFDDSSSCSWRRR